ncbi:MAG: BamA/TamA family outer membrane protein [Saprospiraceae bacterium]|nr:BamA/TamA family outer membrane protein [Saprospiraceae bacterium]MDW8485000.1 BamA/TamA family outer membrane protein [Saprospiraceae bacterium]
MYRAHREILLTICLGLILPAARGQKFCLWLHGLPNELEVAEKSLFHQDKCEARRITAEKILLLASDSIALRSALAQALERWREEAFLLASIDDWVQLSDSVATARLYLGPRLHWMHLRISKADASWLEALGLHNFPKPGELLHPTQFVRWQHALLEKAENRGYPFVSIYLDSVHLTSNGGVSAVLLVKRGPFITFTQPKVNGNVRLSPRHLAQYLGLRPGTPYSRERILRVPNYLRSLMFVQQTEPPTVTFANDQARLNLFLEKKRANRFDLIVGLLPRPNDPAGRMLITGALQMAMLNALNNGESIRLELERLRPETQKLDAQAAFPYIAGTAFGVEGRFQLFRRDSTWTDVHAEAGVQYFLQATDFINFFAESRTLSLQKLDTVQLRQTRQLPSVVDMRLQGFGIQCAFNRLDYRFNPRRGWSFWLRTSAGFSRVIPNSLVENLRDPADSSFHFSSLFERLTQPQARYQADARAEIFIPLGVRTTALFRLRAGTIAARHRPIFINEQYRLGGHKLLRGFDEESLFANRFAVATVETRLLTGQNTFWAAFADVGYLENITPSQRLFLRPWGVGFGLSVETQPGIFSISLAVGKRDTQQPFDWREPKFHLGYVNLF